MQVRLLGPVDVTVDGAPRPVGGLRRKAILAVLALQPGEVVGTGLLIDAVWGNTAPATAGNTLQSHVSHLRRVLGVPAAIRAVPPGYVLDIGGDGTDVQVAERLIQRGAQSADPRQGVGDLQAAVALWRGRALADLAGVAWFDEQARRLERLLAQARQALIGLRLTLGQHAQLVPELENLSQQHPLHEQICGLLMRALYGCGRQSDALAVYQRLRRTLHDDLGIDPSQPLRDLEIAILRQDAALDSPPPAAARGTAVIPAQLPPAVVSFAGRRPQIAQLDRLLPDSGMPGAAHPATVVISAIAGTAGVGKTALAVHWAHRVRGQFPDGQLYVNLRGFDPGGVAMSPEVAVRGFLDAFGVPPGQIPAGLDAQAALYRSLLANRRVLVVLDNARDAGQVRLLLPGTAGCLAVVTSRDQLAGLVAAEGAHALGLDLLTAAEARALLAGRLGAHRLAAEPQAVDDIIAGTSALPLALAIVAARAATCPSVPLTTFATELAQTRTRLDALDNLDAADPVTQVRAVFSWSYSALRPGAARMFRLLGLHPGPDVTAAAAGSLAGIPAPGAGQMLAELTRAHLVTEHRPGRYTAHDLLRVYAAELAGTVDSDQDRRAAVHRMLDHYLHTAYRCDRLLDPTRDSIRLPGAGSGVAAEDVADHQQALAWLTAEHTVLLAAARRAAADGLDTHIWRLTWALTTFHQRRLLAQDWVDTHVAALAAVYRLSARDPAAVTHRDLGDAYRDLGRAYCTLGRYDDARAHLGQALEMYGEPGDDLASQAYTHRYIAMLSEQEGDWQEAVDHARQALSLFRSAGHRAGEAKALNALGWCLALRKDYDQALSYCLQALPLLQDLGDRDGQAHAYDSVGYAYHHLGEYQKAVSCYQHAAGLFAELGDRYFEADILIHLGETHRAAGDHNAARDAWDHALGIVDELGHPGGDQLRAKIRARHRAAGP